MTPTAPPTTPPPPAYPLRGLAHVIAHVRQQNRPNSHGAVLLAEIERLRALPTLTFETVRLMDELRRENHCDEGICAYREGCVCWNEFVGKMKDTTDV